MPRRRPVGLKLLAATASAAPGAAIQAAPLVPPLAWFSDEAADSAPEQFTVYPDGRVAGVVAPAGRCLLDPVLGQRGECWTVPRPADGRGSTLTGRPDDDYALANRAPSPDNDGLYGTLTDEGVLVATGVLAGAGGHAPPGQPHNLAGALRARDYYSDVAEQMARVRYVWSDTAGGVGGVVAVGALWPEVGDRGVAAIMASATSIDYRLVLDEGQYRLVGCCLVNIGGLPTRYAAGLAPVGGALLVDADVVADLAADPTVPRSLVAALADGTVTGMKRRARICQKCSEPERTAAFRAVTPAGPAWYAEVTWSGGVGAFVDMVQMADGSDGWVVHPIAGGLIDDDVRVVVPAADATLTGRRYEWAEVDDDAVLPAGVPTEDGAEQTAGERTAAVGDAATPDLAAEVADLRGRVEKVETLVSDMHEAALGEALAGVDALPTTN